jgi:hypothetical protein
MAKTGESYAAARGQLAEKRARITAARVRLTTTPADRPADEKVVAATGKTWEAWFALLDRWGATRKKHGEIAAHLVKEHGAPGWWSQAVTMWYERGRGLRLKHQQADGFTVYASKTIAASADALFDAFVGARARAGWLTDGRMSLRTSQKGRTARFDWGDGATRVMVSFDGKGPDKTVVAVAHEKLPDPDEAETAKAAWKARLASLKKWAER